MKKTLKRILSAVLVLFLLLTAIPINGLSEAISVFASVTESGTVNFVTDWTVDENNRLAVQVYFVDAVGLDSWELEIDYDNTIFASPTAELGTDAQEVSDCKRNKFYMSSIQNMDSDTIRCLGLFTNSLWTSEEFLADSDTEAGLECIVNSNYFHAFTLYFEIIDMLLFETKETTITANGSLLNSVTSKITHEVEEIEEPDILPENKVASGECGSNLKWIFDNSGTLTIFGTGSMWNYEYLSMSGKSSAPWTSYSNSLTELVINSGTTHIGDYAFYNCFSLKSISIPDGVKSIGQRAFSCCSSLEAISIPDSVVSIESSTFSACSALKNITVPGGITNISASAFYGCSSLEGVTISNGVSNISGAAFSNCTSLESIFIPASVTSISEVAFSNCTSLSRITVDEKNENYSSVDGVLYDKEQSTLIVYPIEKQETDFVIPQSVTTIAENAFSGCTYLESITFPAGITDINVSDFRLCKSFKSFIVDENNANYSSVNGVLYNKEQTTLILYPVAKTDISFTVSENVLSIAENAFSYCSLKNLFILNAECEIFDYNNTINRETTILSYSDSKAKDYAKKYYHNFVQIENTEVIASGACNYNLTWVLDISGTLIISGTGDMGDDTPWHSYSEFINSVIITEGVTSISDYAFSSYPSLVNITIADSVTSIAKTAFYNTAFYNNEENWTDGILYIKEHLIEAKFSDEEQCRIKDGTKYISASAFSNTNMPATVVIPDSLIYIGDNAFEGVLSLENVLFGENSQLKGVGKEAFKYCSALKTINIPSEVSYIGESAFERSGLEKITFDNGSQLTSINSSVFENCDSLTEIIIPAGITTIYPSAFQFCSSLKNVYFEENSQLMTIEERAFYFCSSLEKINIPSGVSYIAEDAFYNCSAFSDISVDDNNEFYSSLDGVLYNKSMTTLLIYPNSKTNPSFTVPDSVTNIHEKAFYGCYYLENVYFGKNSNLKVIGVSAFSGCNFISITIPKSTTTISKEAFNGCFKLSEIIFDDNSRLTSIGDNAFLNCQSLISITIPKGVTSIGKSAFRYCYSLCEVSILHPQCSIHDYSDTFYPYAIVRGYVGSTAQAFAQKYDFCFVALDGNDNDTVVSGFCGDNADFVITRNGTMEITGDGELYNYYNDKERLWHRYRRFIKEVIIADTVTTIGTGMFNDCGQLSTITFPDSITRIGSEAFNECNSLKSLTIPKSVKDIDALAFALCERFEAFNVDPDSTSFYSDEYGVLYTKDRTRLICSPNANGIISYVIPEGVTSIDSKAFYSCDTLVELTIPDSLTNVGSHAFFYCTNLENVFLSNDCKLSGISDYMFSHCEKLNSFLIPKNVTWIGICAFDYCAGLTEITIPASVKSVNYFAFSDCKKLNEITILNPAMSIYNSSDTFYYTTIRGYTGSTAETYARRYSRTFIAIDDLHIHSYNSSVTLNATCSDKGIRTFICECGDSYTKEILATGAHVWDNGVITTKPSAEADGIMTYTCTVCGTTKTEIINDRHIHSYTSSITLNATCSDKGTMTYTCECGDTYTEDIAELGHNFSKSFTVDKNATYTEAGSKSKHCLRSGCSEKHEVTSIPKLVADFKENDVTKVSDKNIVTGSGVTVKEMLSQTEAGAKIEDINGNVLTEDKLPGTGMTLTLADGKVYIIVVFGDADGDSKISASDARLSLRTSVGLENFEEDSAQYKAANVDSKDKVTASDARLILRASVGLEDPKSWLK